MLLLIMLYLLLLLWRTTWSVYFGCEMGSKIHFVWWVFSRVCGARVCAHAMRNADEVGNEKTETKNTLEGMDNKFAFLFHFALKSFREMKKHTH